MTPVRKVEGGQARPPMSQPRREMLARRWALVVVLFLSLALLVFYDVMDDRAILLKSEQERLLTQARMVESNLDLNMASIAAVLRTIARDAGAPGMNRRLAELNDAMPAVRTLLVLDSAGRVTASNREELLLRDFAGRNYFLAPKKNPDAGMLHISPPFTSMLGVYTISVSMAIRQDGVFRGVAAASLDPEYFSTLLSSVRYSVDVSASIVHGGGLLFMGVPEGAGISDGLLAKPGTSFSRHLSSGKSETVHTGTSFPGGNMEILAMRSWNPSGLKLSSPVIIAVSRDLNAVLTDWRRDSLLKILSLLLVGGFLVLGTFYLQRRQRLLDLETELLIEEQAMARHELARSQEWQNTFNSVRDSICLTDLEGRITRCNRATLDLFGISKEQTVGVHCWDIFPEPFIISDKDLLGVARSELRRVSLEINMKGKDFEVTIDPVFSGSGELAGFVQLVRDVNIQRMAQRELKRNYERLELMQDVYEFRATSVQELLDHALAKVIALTDSSIGYIYHYHEDQQQFVLNTWSKGVMESCSVAEPQSIYQLEKTGLWGEVVRQRGPVLVNDYAADNPCKKGYPAGHVHLTRFLSVPVMDDDRIVAVVGVANKTLPYDQLDELHLTLMMEAVWKICTHLDLEMQIARAGHEWQSTFDSIYDSITLLNPDSLIVRCNMATSLMLGREFTEIIGQPSWKLFHAADAPIPDCPMSRAKQSLHSETAIIQQGERWLEISVDPLLSSTGQFTGAVQIVRDISDRTNAEKEKLEMQAQMLQNDKLATIGQLAAGVAHEINNPMGFVGSNMITLGKYIEKYRCYIELIEQKLVEQGSGELPEQVRALRKSLKLDYVMKDINVLVEESNEGIERVKRIVQDLRTFSRADTSSQSFADLNRCMDSTINIVINEIKYAAELRRDYGEIPKVSCNVQQINQVFMNLLINAAHAIQAKGDDVGEIVIRTWCDGDNVFVSVSDTGCGIEPENMDKIFDAFFTTKDVGKGTGLGLSISANIISKHGGEISVESEPGTGTTFTVRLPLSSAPMEFGSRE